MSKERFFIGKQQDGRWVAFSTKECKDPETRVDLQELAQKHGFIRANGEYPSFDNAERAAEKHTIQKI